MPGVSLILALSGQDGVKTGGSDGSSGPDSLEYCMQGQKQETQLDKVGGES